MPPLRSSRRAAQAKTLPAKRLAAAAYDTIKARILAGDYRPGDRLSVEEFSAELHVSRQPVMDAMRRLAGEWLVEIIPQVGCRVASFDHQALLDYLVVTSEIEGRVAALAAQRRTPEQLEHLFAVLDQMTGQESDLVEVYADFHDTLLAMADSQLVARLSTQLRDFSEFVWSTLTASRSNADVPLLERRLLTELSEAIRAQDVERARLHMTVFWTTYARTLTQEGGVQWARADGIAGANDAAAAGAEA